MTKKDSKVINNQTKCRYLLISEDVLSDKADKSLIILVKLFRKQNVEKA